MARQSKRKLSEDMWVRIVAKYPLLKRSKMTLQQYYAEHSCCPSCMAEPDDNPEFCCCNFHDMVRDHAGFIQMCMHAS